MNLPLSEQYRIAAEAWVDREAAANVLEETKSAFLAEKKAGLGDIPDTHAERIVKASQEWRDFITAMCAARRAANHAKVRVEVLRMRFWEYNSAEATKRKEMGM